MLVHWGVLRVPKMIFKGQGFKTESRFPLLWEATVILCKEILKDLCP